MILSKLMLFCNILIYINYGHKIRKMNICVYYHSYTLFLIKRTLLFFKGFNFSIRYAGIRLETVFTPEIIHF